MDSGFRLNILDNGLSELAFLNENFEQERNALPKKEQTADWLLRHQLGMQDVLLRLVHSLGQQPIPWPLRACDGAIHDLVRHGGSKLLNRRAGSRSDRFYDSLTRETIQAITAATFAFMKAHNFAGDDETDLARKLSKALTRGGYTVGLHAVKAWYYRWTAPSRFWDGERRKEPMLWEQFDWTFAYLVELQNWPNHPEPKERRADGLMKDQLRKLERMCREERLCD